MAELSQDSGFAMEGVEALAAELAAPGPEVTEEASIAQALGLDRPGKHLNTTEAAKALGISTGSVRSAIGRRDLSGHQVTGRIGYGEQNFWRVPAAQVAVLVTSGEPPAWLHRARKAWDRSATRCRIEEATALRAAEMARCAVAKQRQAADLDDARRAVRPRIRERHAEPASVVFHVGPTNSGKTHDALRANRIITWSLC